MLTGFALALINAIRRGVYYTRSTLISDVSAELNFKSKSIKQLSRKSISEIILFISKRRVVALDEATLKLANKRIVYILNSGGQPTSSNTARLLATHSAQSGRNVVLCDPSGQSEKEVKDKPAKKSSDLPVVSMGDNISLMIGAHEESFFTSKHFSSKIKNLTDRFDQVFICSSNRNAQLGLIALSEFVPGLVMISNLRKTKKLKIKNIKKRQPIDLLFHD
jgi:hypothetical protein